VQKSPDKGVADPSLADVDAVAREVGGDVENGLSSSEAARRLAESGPNALRATPPVPLWRRAIAQFRDPLVYLLLAAQYESWIAPIAVVVSVPLSLVGPVLVLRSLGVANNLYTQIGLVLLIALAAKNAILIVEVARERRAEGREIIESAVAAAQTRFRPILMTSFAFILGMLPLVLATGAGANARRSIGVSVASGMLASTCLAVLFVPSFFVLLQRHEEARLAAKRKRAAAAAD